MNPEIELKGLRNALNEIRYSPGNGKLSAEQITTTADIAYVIIKPAILKSNNVENLYVDCVDTIDPIFRLIQGKAPLVANHINIQLGLRMLLDEDIPTQQKMEALIMFNHIFVQDEFWNTNRAIVRNEWEYDTTVSDTLLSQVLELTGDRRLFVSRWANGIIENYKSGIADVLWGLQHTQGYSINESTLINYEELSNSSQFYLLPEHKKEIVIYEYRLNSLLDRLSNGELTNQYVALVFAKEFSQYIGYTSEESVGKANVLRRIWEKMKKSSNTKIQVLVGFVARKSIDLAMRRN